jgi:hypothetical protein
VDETLLEQGVKAVHQAFELDKASVSTEQTFIE